MRTVSFFLTVSVWVSPSTTPPWTLILKAVGLALPVVSVAWLPPPPLAAGCEVPPSLSSPPDWATTNATTATTTAAASKPILWFLVIACVRLCLETRNSLARALRAPEPPAAGRLAQGGRRRPHGQRFGDQPA